MEILGALAAERAADVLEAMGPNDGRHLLAQLPTDQAEALLALMEPEEDTPGRLRDHLERGALDLSCL